MEVQISTLFIILIVIAAVSSVAYYIAHNLQPTSHPESLTVTNVIPFRQTTQNTIIYNINFRLVCADQPSTLRYFIVEVLYGNGNKYDYNIVASNGAGTYTDNSNGVTVYVGLNPATSLVCSSSDYNAGKDMTITVSLQYNSGTPPPWFNSLQISYISLYGVIPSNKSWQATIYLPESQINIG